jgi:hypothetical protein
LCCLCLGSLVVTMGEVPGHLPRHFNLLILEVII